MLPVVLNLGFDVLVFVLLLLLGKDSWNLDSNGVVLVLEVDGVAVFHLELFALGTLVQDFELQERDEVRLEIRFLDLHALEQVMVCQGFLVVEKHQNAHLIGGDTQFVLPVGLAYSCSDLGVTLVDLPMQNSARELDEVVLLV